MNNFAESPHPGDCNGNEIEKSVDSQWYAKVTGPKKTKNMQEADA